MTSTPETGLAPKYLLSNLKIAFDVDHLSQKLFVKGAALKWERVRGGVSDLGRRYEVSYVWERERETERETERVVLTHGMAWSSTSLTPAHDSPRHNVSELVSCFTFFFSCSKCRCNNSVVYFTTSEKNGVFLERVMFEVQAWTSSLKQSSNGMNHFSNEYLKPFFTKPQHKMSTM